MVVNTEKFKETEKVIKNILIRENGTVLPDKALDIIKSIGIPTPAYVLVKTVKEAIEASKAIGFPVVLKIASPEVLHKSDVGGVVIDVKSEEEVAENYHKVMDNLAGVVSDARIKGELVQEQAQQATQVIIGGIMDEQFGPAVMFGLGGVFVELFKDVSFRIAPVTENEALEMIKEIKGYPILSGYRGAKMLDIPQITKAIVTISELISSIDEIKEVELNPLLVYEKGITAVDARIILES